MSAAWYRRDPGAAAVLVNVHVQPNAKVSAIAGLHGDALRIRIAAPAVDDKANAALLELLRRTLGVPAHALKIRHGAHARRKLVAIAADAPEVIEKLCALAGG